MGPDGILIQGDITNLPIRDGAVDTALCLHVIYHVPRDEQPGAFRELHRVVRPGGVAVVGYSWGVTPWGELSLPRKAIHFPVRVVRKLGRVRAARAAPVAQPASSAPEPDLYFHAYDHGWFSRQPWPFEADIVVNHSLTSPVLSRIAGRGLWGTQLLTLLTAYEDRFPRLAGRVGRYPLIIIRG